MGFASMQNYRLPNPDNCMFLPYTLLGSFFVSILHLSGICGGAV